MARPAVRVSTEFRRVHDLPRRIVGDVEAEEHNAAWTEAFKRRGGSMRLVSRQGQAVTETLECRGFVGALPVGFGKTLLFYLQILALGSERPVIITSKSLIEPTWDLIAGYAKHWKALPHPLQILSREALGRPGHEHDLDEIAPDFVGVDEADRNRNLSTAAGTKRIDRYRRKNLDTVFSVVTGTLSRDQIMGFWHLLCWGHPRGGAPVPYDMIEAQTWAAAIDGRGIRGGNIDPGPLGPTSEAAAEWFMHRLDQTPGVILHDEDSCKAPLTIRLRLAPEDPRLDVAYERFLMYRESPGGDVVEDPLSRWRIDAYLGVGVDHYFDPPPPKPWMDARRAACAFSRDRIAASQAGMHPLDSMGVVFKRYASTPVVAKWLAIKAATPKPITKLRWVTDSCVQACRGWLAESAEPAIVWVGSPEFGERLALKARLPYFGRLGKSREGQHLGSAAVRGRTVVASWKANLRGLNLQPWNRHLVVMVPQSAADLEQLFGRGHRRGREDALTYDVLVTSGGTLDAFDAAIAEASGAKRTTKITEKILRATIIRPTPAITAGNRYRWATKRSG